MADKKLKPEVAAAFELAQDTPVVGGFAGFGALDLSELTLEQAQGLVANGFKGLVPKKTKTEKNS